MPQLSGTKRKRVAFSATVRVREVPPRPGATDVKMVPRSKTSKRKRAPAPPTVPAPEQGPPKKKKREHKPKPTRPKPVSLWQEPTKPRHDSYKPVRCCAEVAERWGVREHSIRKVLEYASRDVFVFGNADHGGFGVAWAEAWDACGLPRHNKDNVRDTLVYSCYGVLHDSSRRNGKAVPLVEVTHVETAEHTTRYRMRECEFEGVMCTVIAGTSWCAGVQRQRQVPSALLRGLLVMKLELSNAFPGMPEREQEAALPNWINLCVNAPRTLHHMRPGGTLDQLREADLGAARPRQTETTTSREEDDDDLQTHTGSDGEEEDDDDADRYSDCSSNERNAFYTQSLDGKVPAQERSLDLLPERGSDVRFTIFADPKTRRSDEETATTSPETGYSRPIEGLQAYELSALAFGLAARAQALLSEREGSSVAEAWHPVRIYHFFVHWLRMSDHVVAPVADEHKPMPPVAPEVVLLHASLLLSLLERRVADQLHRQVQATLALAPDHVQATEPSRGPPPHADLLLWQDSQVLLDQWCPSVRDLVRLHCQRERSPGHFVGFKLFGDVSRYGGPMPCPPVRHSSSRPQKDLLDQLERDRHTLAKRLREQFFLSQADMRGKLVLVIDRARVHPLSLKRTVQVCDDVARAHHARPNFAE